MNLLTTSFVQFSKIACFVTVAACQAQVGSQPELSQNIHWSHVSGAAIHYFSQSKIHQSNSTDTGKIEHSTDIIELSGDLLGTILYHVTSNYNFVDGTLTNTGHQVFSGTILGEAPVMLLDDDFIFKVNLNTGETLGEVFLTKRVAGEAARCVLTVEGVGFDDEGNGLANYYGRCRTAH